MNKFSIDEMLFAIGHYPTANATEKFLLYVEQMEELFPGILKDQPYIVNKEIKKLSPKKKASFMLYLKTLDIKETMVHYKDKKINWKDGVQAILTLIKYRF